MNCERCALDDAQVKQRFTLGAFFLLIALGLITFHRSQQIRGWQSYAPFVPLFFGVLHLLQSKSKRCTAAAFTSKNRSVKLGAAMDLLLAGISSVGFLMLGVVL